MLKRTLAIILTLISVVALLTSCGTKEENAQIKAYSSVFVDALIANEPDTAYELVKDAISREEFTPIFDNMRRYIDSGITYELTQTGWKTSKSGDTITVTATFEMKTPEHTYKVVASTTDGKEGLSGFQILILDPDKTGTITTMKGATPIQWVVLIIAILEIGFVLWMLIDCILHKVQRKAVWIIFILLGMLAISVTWSEAGMNTTMTLGLIINMTMLAKYETGATVLRLLVPVGAIIYAVMRNNLIIPRDTDNTNTPKPVHSLHSEDENTQNR